MNKRTATGILGLGAAAFLALGLYRPPTRPANNYEPAPEIVYESSTTPKKPFINENLRRNMEKARKLYPLGIIPELEEEKPKTFEDLEDEVEACLDELPDFKIVCLNRYGLFGKEQLPIIIDIDNEETPIATQDGIDKFFESSGYNNSFIHESICNPRRKQKLYDFLKVVGESRKKSSDPNYMEAIGLNSGNWRRAEECIEKTSKFFAYEISKTIHEYLKTDDDLKKEVALARDALDELKDLMETDSHSDLKENFEMIMEGLSSSKNDSETYEIIREFDNEGIHTIRYLARTGVENPEMAQEFFDFIEKNNKRSLYFDLQAEVSLKNFVDSFRGYKDADRKNNVERAVRLIEEINGREYEVDD
ncbi:MAG: hypothetical protein Q8Q01_05295 [archaeon]|nr:hypothetical protein [archaeon]